MMEENKILGKPKGALGDLVKAETMIQLAIALPAACVVGWLGGAWADKHFGTHWISIAGIVLGAVAGFVKIIATATKYIKNNDE
ncbi:MAG: AtpZ/AtpI family protein [Acidobacteria bacterium]|nr:AtpZ/AtpI family protein [Acidobacteriota bacterium]